MEYKDPSFLLAKHFVESKFEDLPEGILEETKKQVLDYIGVAIAGSCREGAKEVTELFTEMGGAEQARAWGCGKKLPVITAAHINATIGHCNDFDDVQEKAVMHPGVVAIPTTLTLGDYVGGLTGKEIVTDIALSGDMICRMSLASAPDQNKIPFGWHMTTLMGSMVSANLASRILGLDIDKSVYAMGIAYHQTAGNGQPVKDSVLTKRLGPGFSVRNGITSALLAQKGVTGVYRIFTGEWGFPRQYFQNNWNEEYLIGDLGKRWESATIAIKPYPCCRGLHHFCDVAIEMHNQMGINPDDIEKIELWCGTATVGLLGQPLEKKAFPKIPVDAQFSIAWGVASGLALGHVTLNEYEDNATGIFNEKILAVSKKIVSLEGDPELNFPGFDGARVKVTMKDGTVHDIIRRLPKGTADNPLTMDDVIAKFYGCLASSEKTLSKENVEKILDIVNHLEDLDDSRKLTDLIVWG